MTPLAAVAGYTSVEADAVDPRGRLTATLETVEPAPQVDQDFLIEVVEFAGIACVEPTDLGDERPMLADEPFEVGCGSM